ncbi:hypothetical protein [Mesorhizobium sp. ORS 3428]|uniref:hypothetical protein n=1 Tax=Mesorhizobium sp. ORS 3428 TaxID=540997 RepID=UPI0008D9F9D1|nr:hypothetical protein [Mesorhizobium sp. ORS 3428]OHV89238.1 hypothetical protein ORS3428_16155 [Mesorhizobium sp. ORS 3428]
MIDQEEIKAKAIEFDIHHPNVERDYVFGWLPKSIFENDYLRSRLVFKGLFSPPHLFEKAIFSASPGAAVISMSKMVPRLNDSLPMTEHGKLMVR